MRTRIAAAWTLVFGISLAVSSGASATWDYPLDAGPPIKALVEGHLHAFLTLPTDMGPLSMLLRAPFVWVSAQLTAPDPFFDTPYRWGVFPCMVVAGAFGIVLARELRKRGRPELEQLAVLLLCMANAVTLRAIHFGHPEEVVGAVLVAGAVLAAVKGRVGLAAVLLAAGLLNKQWAVLAILPVAVAAGPVRWRRPALWLGAALVVLAVPLLAVDADGIFDTLKRMADLRNTQVLPASVWFPFTHAINPAEPGHHAIPDWLGVVARPLVIATCLATALAYARRVREAPLERALPLLALVMLLRCVLDPADNGYYHVPFFMALVAADALAGRLLPSIVTTAALYLITELASTATSLNVTYLVWALPTVAYLAGRSYGLDWSALLRSRGVRGPGVARTLRQSASVARSPEAR